MLQIGRSYNSLGSKLWIYGIAAAAGAAILLPQETQAAALYSDLYDAFNAESSVSFSETASWAYFANQADGFGGVVGFDSEIRALSSASVIMSNWNGWDPRGGPGMATDAYETELTLELYEVDRSRGVAAPGRLIATDTETHEIAGRQIPDSTHENFVGNGTNFRVDWDLDNLPVNADEVLFMVRVDNLTDVENFSQPAGDPFEAKALQSLNIAAFNTATLPDVTAGTDTDPGIFWRSSAFTAGDISRFTAADIGGTLGGAQVMAQFSGQPADVPEPAALAGLGAVGLGLMAQRRRAGTNA